jgi:tetratricopeptide (TPR) repeat protein
MLKRLVVWFLIYPGICLLFIAASPVFAQESEKAQTGFDPEAFEHFVIGNLYELSMDFHSALAEYQKAVALQPDIRELRYALAMAYLATKDVESAKQQALEIHPKDAKTYQLLGECYRVAGQDDSALWAYSRAVEQDSTDVNSLWRLAVLWQLKNDLNQAIHYWKMVATLQTFSPQVHLQLATLLFQAQKLDDAISEYRKVLDLQPDNPKSFYGLAEVYEAKHDTTQAIDLYRRYLKLDPVNKQVRGKLIALLYQTGRKDEAMSQAGTFSMLAPDDLEAKKRLGALYLSSGDYPQAESVFISYLEADPDDPQVHFFLGRIALEKEDFNRAKSEFETTVALSDSVLDGWINLAMVYLRQDSTQRAIQIYQQARGKVRDDSYLLYMIGNVYAQKQNYDSALVYLSKASDKSPHETQILFSLGSVYERNGDFDQSVAIFERLLRIDSTNAQALNYLGYMFAEKGIRLEESLDMIQKALESDPNNAAYLDSYGWVLFRLGRLEEAEIQIKKALDAVSTDSIIHEHLGDIYQAQGWTENAKTEWQEALRLQPDNENVKKKLEQ